MRDLLDDDGENRAVRTFLMQYGVPGLTVAAMAQHMRRSGWESEYWPDFAMQVDNAGQHLTKAGAQIWIRHLFSLEQHSGNPASTADAEYDRELVRTCGLMGNTASTGREVLIGQDIEAADRHAALYEDDDRECIKADVINSFYAGITYERKRVVERRELTDTRILEIYRRTFPAGPYIFTADAAKFARAIEAELNAGSARPGGNTSANSEIGAATSTQAERAPGEEHQARDARWYRLLRDTPKILGPVWSALESGEGIDEAMELFEGISTPLPFCEPCKAGRFSECEQVFPCTILSAPSPHSPVGAKEQDK